MKTHISTDRQVTKYVHDDNSETCIKTVPSLDTKTISNGTVELEVVDRNKYSVFVSDSSGCPFNCSFCYLTIDQMPYKKLGRFEMLDNVWDGIKHRIEMEPAIANRYIKICWMGMGEPILRSNRIYTATWMLLDRVFKEGYAKGLDGVDLSTILPKLKGDEWLDDLQRLNAILAKYPLNPNNKQADNVANGSSLVRYTNRSRFRLFYSLHSAIQETRDRIIPNAMPIVEATDRLEDLSGRGIDVIIHHMFLEGINDSEEEVEAVINFMENFPQSELRILRYNRHEGSTIRESNAFKQCMCLLKGRVPKIKVQISQGTEVKSACGQFLYNATPREEANEHTTYTQ